MVIFSRGDWSGMNLIQWMTLINLGNEDIDG